jgi:hypothetical protein
MSLSKNKVVLYMIWKVSAIYKIAYKAKQHSGKYARRDKPCCSFDEFFNSALSSPTDSKLARRMQTNKK